MGKKRRIHLAVYPLDPFAVLRTGKVDCLLLIIQQQLNQQQQSQQQLSQQ